MLVFLTVRMFVLFECSLKFVRNLKCWSAVEKNLIKYFTNIVLTNEINVHELRGTWTVLCFKELETNCFDTYNVFYIKRSSYYTLCFVQFEQCGYTSYAL